jgi:hypothetical protein
VSPPCRQDAGSTFARHPSTGRLFIAKAGRSSSPVATLHIESIQSLEAPELAWYRTLKRPEEHERAGVLVATNEKVVRRLLTSRFPVVSALLIAGCGGAPASQLPESSDSATVHSPLDAVFLRGARELRLRHGDFMVLPHFAWRVHRAAFFNARRL